MDTIIKYYNNMIVRARPVSYTHLPVARQCGGCQLQAMSYEAQLKFKEKKIYNNLLRIGKFAPEEINMLPIIGMEDPWRYRNKAQFPFGLNKEGDVISGFYAGRTHSIIENEDCLIGAYVNLSLIHIYSSSASIWLLASSMM